MDINAYIESGIIESYVLGLASAEEAAELEKLAMEHPAVKKAVDDFAFNLQNNAVENGIAPPAALKQQIIDALAGEFEEPAVITMPVAAQIDKNTGGGKVVYINTPGAWRYIAVAAVILFVVSAGLNFYYYSNYKTASNNYQALLDNQKTLQAYETKYNGLQQTVNILQDSAMHVVKMAGVKGKEGSAATIYWDNRTKDVYVYINNLPQAPAGKQYQLWAIVDGKPVDAGMISTEKNVYHIQKMKSFGKAEAFAITLETAGGHPQPKGDMIVHAKI